MVGAEGFGAEAGEEGRGVGEVEVAEEVGSGAAGEFGFVAGGQDGGAGSGAEPGGGAGGDDFAGRGEGGSLGYLAPRRRWCGGPGGVRPRGRGQLGPQPGNQHPRPLRARPRP